MPFANSHDGVRLFYQVEGPADAAPIIFSNSLGCDLMMWQPQADALRHRFRVIRYDQRGHGASDVPDGAYTLDELGRDVLALADHLGLGKFSFCGLSMGGLTGQWLGVNAADRLDRLVLADTSAAFPPPAMWDDRLASIARAGLKELCEPILERFFCDRFRTHSPVTVDRFRHCLLSMSPAGYAGCCHALKAADLSQEIAAIAVPTLVISGRLDPSTPPERAEFIVSQIAGARLAMLEAAHISNIEQPDGFTAALLEFLDGDALPADARFRAGLARRRAVLGDQWVDRSIARRSAVNADFQDLITRYAWGEIWTRPGLDDETRRLLVLAITAALGRWEEFDLHVKAALDVGVSLDTLKEVLLQTAIYAGVPAANTGFRQLERILETMAE